MRSVSSGTTKTRSPNSRFPLFGSTGPIGLTRDAAYMGDAVLVARVGANAGFVYRVDGRYGVTDNTLIVKTGDDIEVGFLEQYLTYLDLNRQIYGSGQPLITGKILKDLPFPAFGLCEQTSISNVLASADTLITSLERLITKKRNIKQGLLQELLKGRTRLSGFSTDWADVAFNDVARPVSERIMPMSSKGRVIELEHLGAGTGELLGDSDLHDSISLKTRFKTGDVLFGKLRSYLRKFWLADVDGFCSTEIWALRPANGTASSFLRYLVETEEFIEAASTAYGTHMPRADWNVVSRLEVSLPPLDEQHAIAKVLLETDAEIVALERRLTSTRAIKQGMMQELLTGRTRLVTEAAA